jgi:intein/homing endonuclease
VWSGGVQPQEEGRFGAVAAFGGTMAGITALGFMPVGRRRVWDYYLKAIRGVEEISPARIFRTFQYSELLSPLGSNRAFEFPAELFTYQYQRAGKAVTAPNRAMRRFMANMLGRPIAELEQAGVFSRGLEFRRTGWMFGEVAVKGGPVLSTAALPMRVGSHAGGSFVDWYARLTGIQLGITEGVARTSSAGMMAITVPKVDRVLGIPISEVAQVRLQKARVAGRMARAYWAGQIGRLNRLLAAPADWFPALGRVMKRVGIRSLTVKPGSAMQMLGRYTAKGLAIAGAYKGFQYLSYLRGQTDNRLLSGAGFAVLGGALGGILRHTRRGAMIGAAVGAIVGTAPLFDRGVIEGAATAYTQAAMGYARASKATGLTASRREQEELMPGITKARTLLGFTTGGMMMGLLGGYALKLAQFKQMGIEGASKFMETQAEAIRARAQGIRTARPGLVGRAAAWLGQRTGAGAARGLRGRILMRGGWIGAMLGAASFGALAIGAAWGTGNVLPGIVGARHTPEELERLYTGREDVPIRRGRWWEFGRSPWEGGRIAYYRPHWYHMLMSKAKIRGLWGSEREKWEASPMLHPLKALFDEEFKYRWEREHYYERPYPMTGTYGADVPFLAPITETLGGLIKPPRLMHTEEWLAGTGLEGAVQHGAVKHVMTAAEHEPAYDLGGLKKGVPISRHQADQQLGEFIYRMNELRGLTGFIHSAVKESLTGSQDYFDKMEQLETAQRAYGCLHADTLIITADGEAKRIVDIVPNDLVTTHSGQIAKVVDVVRKQAVSVPGEGELCSIKVVGNKRELRLTPDHLVWVYPGKWKEAGSIETGDYVSLPHKQLSTEKQYVLDLAYCDIGAFFTTEHLYPKASREFASAYELCEEYGLYHVDISPALRGRVKKAIQKSNIYRYPRYIELSREFGYFIGLFLAEGNFIYQQTNGRLSGIKLTLHTKEAHFIDRIRNEILRHVASIQTAVYPNKPNTLNVLIYGRTFAECIRFLCGEKESKLVGSLLYSNSACRKGIIEGLIDGDGHISCRENTITFSQKTARKQLVYALRDLLIFENIGYSAIGIKQPSDTDSGNYSLKLTGFASEKIRNTMGWDLADINTKFRGDRKNWFWDEYGQLWIKVKDVSSCYTDQVYDIVLDHPEHSFMTDVCSVHNSERAYWDKELGGLLGTTEAFRRFLPHRRRQIELYNPIRNLMPEWLPGPEYYIDFLHGDPYTKVKEGEIRLPGRGYEALHPDVAGLAPEEYPLFHRFRILSDVAMYSDQFKKTRREMRSAIRRGELSEGQIEQFNRLNQQVSERKKRKRFTEYRFAQDALEERRVTVADILPSGMIRTERQGMIGLGGVELAAEKGTGDYRRKQVLMADYLREYVQPGMELDVFTHRDPLHRFKKGPAGYYQPAVIQAGDRNLGEQLVDAEIMRFAEDEDPFAIRTKYNAAQRTLGGLWETISHYESPREYLLPLSPKAKFIHHRSAIEEYERTRLWGTEAAFWQHPIEHFLEPAAGMAAREWFGTTEIPEDIQRRRAIEDYFDRLKWMKYRVLERAAVQQGDAEAIKEFKAQQRRTLFGVNPYGSLSYVYSAMPSLDRDYYESFKDAQSPEDRATIMEMVAPNQRKLYMAQWRNRLAVSLKARMSMGLADPSAEKTLESLNMSRYAEGREITPKLWGQYKREAERGETYADWSRRREAADYFTQEAPLPGPNWVGWHPHVDLEDVKLKIVDNMGEDMHDYNLWPSRKRTLVRKPYITDEPLTTETQHPSDLAKAIEGQLRSVLGLKNVQVHVLPAAEGQDEVQLDIADGRQYALQKYKADPLFQEMI